MVVLITEEFGHKPHFKSRSRYQLHINKFSPGQCTKNVMRKRDCLMVEQFINTKDIHTWQLQHLVDSARWRSDRGCVDLHHQTWAREAQSPPSILNEVEHVSQVPSGIAT